jgi:CDP-diacylglycerol---glycerol-3-phosphate 3-phosphatidyltransferase
MNVINYREDEDTLIALLKEFAANGELSSLKLATGYFNLQEELISEIKKSASLKTDFLTSSPRANGFYRAGRFKKFIPGMYRVNELRILRETQKHKNVRMFEYENGEWTFHAKGAWLYEKTQPQLPQMTIVGSSNFSRRSNRRDVEAQLYIVSDCDNFKQRMHDECQSLFSKASEMNIKTLQNDGTDKITLTEKVLNRVLHMLL